MLRPTGPLLVGCGPRIGRILRAFRGKLPDPKADKAGRNLSSQSPTQTIAQTGTLRLREEKGRRRQPSSRWPARGAEAGCGAGELSSRPLAALRDVVFSAPGAFSPPPTLRRSQGPGAGEAPVPDLRQPPRLKPEPVWLAGGVWKRRQPAGCARSAALPSAGVGPKVAPSAPRSLPGLWPRG